MCVVSYLLLFAIADAYNYINYDEKTVVKYFVDESISLNYNIYTISGQ
jgi:hypothetical protein